MKKCKTPWLELVVPLLFLTGCPAAKPPDLCAGGAPNCAAGAPYECKSWAGIVSAECHFSQLHADQWCASKGGGNAVEVDCEDYDGSTGDAGDDAGDDDGSWEPDQYVTSVSRGSYSVDYALVYQIENDFTLLENDSAVLVESGTGDYFQLSGVASTDLAALLGLQSGDILLSVNGYSLDGIEDIMTAYSAIENDSTLVLSYERAGTVYTHTYSISYTQQR